MGELDDARCPRCDEYRAYCECQRLPMKHFVQADVEEAVAYAQAGGQALHTHRIIVDWNRAPACFRREVRAGREIAHLFDQDAGRLIATVKKLGVRVILVERRGQPGQHVDLCGVPLRKALAMCEWSGEVQGTLV